jgi:hypothetical protein
VSLVVSHAVLLLHDLLLLLLLPVAVALLHATNSNRGIGRTSCKRRSTRASHTLLPSFAVLFPFSPRLSSQQQARPAKDEIAAAAGTRFDGGRTTGRGSGRGSAARGSGREEGRCVCESVAF